MLLFPALVAFPVLPEVFLDDELCEIERDFLLAVFFEFVQCVDATGPDDRAVFVIVGTSCELSDSFACFLNSYLSSWSMMSYR